MKELYPTCAFLVDILFYNQPALENKELLAMALGCFHVYIPSDVAGVDKDPM